MAPETSLVSLIYPKGIDEDALSLPVQYTSVTIARSTVNIIGTSW
jgi:hypothetical protein